LAYLTSAIGQLMHHATSFAHFSFQTCTHKKECFHLLVTQ